MSDDEIVSLPMVSDMMRCEATVIREAADRAAQQMGLVEKAVQSVHERLRALENYIRDLERHGTIDHAIAFELLHKIPTPTYE